MAKYSNTKAKINEKITTNAVQAITGNILNDVLQTMVDSLGADYQFGGLVQPGSPFTAGEQPVVFLATTPGTYTNFGGLVVADGEVALLVWSGTAWSKQTPDIATRTELNQLGQDLTGDINQLSEEQYIQYSFSDENCGLLNSGSVTTATNYGVTDFISVKEGDRMKHIGFVGSSSVWASVCGYDANKVFVQVLVPGYDGNQKDTDFVIPNGVAFIRAMALGPNDSRYVDRFIGKKETDEIGTLIDDINQSVTELSEDKTKLQKAAFSPCPFPYVGAIMLNGVLSPNATSYGTTEYIPVEEGNIVSLIALTGFSTKWASIYGYDANKQPVGVLVEGFNTITKSVMYTIPSGISFVRASGLSSSDSRYVDRFFGTSLSRDVEVLSQDLASLRREVLNTNEMPENSRLDNNTILGSSTSALWYPFRNANVVVNDGYVSITTPGSALYEGIRMARPSFLETGKEYKVKFSARGSGVIIFFVGPDIIAKIIDLTSAWQEFELTLTPESTWERFQFGTSPETATTYELKDFAVYDISNVTIETRVAELEEGVRPFLKDKKISIIGDSISSSARNNAPYWRIVASDVGTQIQSYVTWADVYQDWDGTTPTNKTIGGVSLTEEMVGTLQTFTPIAEDVGKTLGEGQVYNPNSIITWSERLCQKSGAIWLSNAAWSSARMTTGNYGDDGQIAGSTGYSDCTIGRLRKRNDDGSFETPDVVLIYMGTNDMTHNTYAHIDDIDIMSGIPQDDLIDGVHQFRAAYFRCIQKVRETYPNATIFCCTLNVFKRINYAQFPTNNGIYTLPQMNNAIREIANTMGCGLIEFDKDGITFENCYPTYISDSATIPTHPNNTGHEAMAMKALADIEIVFITPN